MLGSWDDQEIDTIPLPSSQLGYPREAASTGPIALSMSLWLDSVYETVVHLVWA